jgi:hypothetical protein
MASIGSVTVNTMKGAPTVKATASDSYARPGSDRIDRRDLGKRPTPTIIETTSFITGEGLPAAANTARSTRRALKGTSVTVTDSHGTEHATTFIADVDVAPAQAVWYAGAAAMLIVTRWTVEGGV